jgi:hypothetical protein
VTGAPPPRTRGALLSCQRSSHETVGVHRPTDTMLTFKRFTLAAVFVASATIVAPGFADAPNAPQAMPGGHPGALPGAMPGEMPPPFGEHLPPGPGFAVINDLEHLQRLYDLSGREAEMNAIYHDVLSKTTDPMIRHYVYDALARNELKPANVDEAIGTIHTSLNEDLETLAKHPQKAAKTP